MAGDRVAAVITNVPEAVIGFLAAASIGAVWSVAAPDMGHRAVVERFEQIQPVLLLAAAGYRFGGRWHDRTAAVNQLLRALPSVRTLVVASHVDGEATVLEDFGQDGVAVLAFEAVVEGRTPIKPEWLDFDHPLWIVYSSGTTGKPKAIVHGHGGMLMMTMCTLALHNDTHADDRLMWMSSTGWIVWNVQVSALLLGATIVLTDGSPMGRGGTADPDPASLWKLVGRHRVNLFGAGCAWLIQCMKAGLVPREAADLSALRSLGATGSPLPADTYRWAMQAVGSDLHLMVVSGGTDIAGGFITCTPTLPVFAGEMQCRGLGAAVQAFDEQGRPLIGAVGELVCTAPLPSMPLFFWGDDDGSRYRDSYFDTWPGVWRHGDWMQLIDRRAQGGAIGAVIFGRSDATINRHGLRLGTSEIYRAIEGVPEVIDSLAVDLEYLGKPSALLLFVVLQPGVALDAALDSKLRDTVRRELSPRFIPDEIHAMQGVPRTLTGKKLELPLRRLLLGQSAEQALPRDTVADPAGLQEYVEFAQRRAG
jgi:acetoacetyl-CoA synthetase